MKPLRRVPWGIMLVLGIFIMPIAMLTGCASEEKPDIVFMIHNDNGSFGSLIRAEFVKLVEARGRKVTVFNAEGDADKQISQFTEAVRGGARYIVLMAVDEAKIVPEVEQAVKQGVIVVPLNRHLRSKVVPGVYPGEYGAGVYQADFLAERLQPGAKVVYLQGAMAQYSSLRRWEGFRDRLLDKRRDIEILDQADGDYRRDKGKEIMQGWLAKYEKIDGVVAGNDNMALGAIEALKEAGRLGGCQVLGIDATAEALEAVAAGEMAQTVKQDPAHQAAGAFQLLEEQSRGLMMPGDIQVPFMPITKENLARYK